MPSHERYYQNQGQGFEAFRRITRQEHPQLSNLIAYSSDSPDTSEKPTNHPWEALTNEPTSEQKFVVAYSGPYAQRLEINRANAERFMRVAAIDGRIMLTDLSSTRGRQIEGVNSDGSVTQRKGLFWGDKINKDGSEATYSQVTKVAGGYRIGISGQAILDDERKKESKKPLETRFVERFNSELAVSLMKAIGKEKLSLDTRYNLSRWFWTLFYPGIYFSISLQDGQIDSDELFRASAFTLLTYGFENVIGFRGSRKTLNSLPEYFMPPVEFDRYARGIAFMNLKGRNLVRLVK